MPEEYYDYVFPNEEKASGKQTAPHIFHPLRLIPGPSYEYYSVGLKILENAMKWKQMMAAGAPASSS
jgi:hypothetical protein